MSQSKAGTEISPPPIPPDRKHACNVLLAHTTHFSSSSVTFPQSQEGLAKLGLQPWLVRGLACYIQWEGPAAESSWLPLCPLPHLGYCLTTLFLPSSFQGLGPVASFPAGFFFSRACSFSVFHPVSETDFSYLPNNYPRLARVVSFSNTTKDGVQIMQRLL
jgi:hypothetical protein